MTAAAARLLALAAVACLGLLRLAEHWASDESATASDERDIAEAYRP